MTTNDKSWKASAREFGKIQAKGVGVSASESFNPCKEEPDWFLDLKIDCGKESIRAVACALGRARDEVNRITESYDKASDIKDKLSCLNHLVNQVAPLIGQLRIDTVMKAATELTAADLTREERRGDD